MQVQGLQGLDNIGRFPTRIYDMKELRRPAELFVRSQPAASLQTGLPKPQERQVTNHDYEGINQI